MCDIEQMFHQFRVNPDDRNYLRFLWWNNGDFTGKVVEYRMCVHLFGAVSSPGCANFALKKTADDNEMEFGTKAANFVRHDFYVDDGLESTATAEEAVQLVRNSVGLCANGGLRLHKFVSNCEDVMNAIPPEDRAKGLKELNVPSDSLPVERALGVQWSIENDTFQFCIKMSDTPLTRRGILSTVSSIFDPLGFLAPVVLKGKLMLQELCKDAADWDAPIPDSLRRKWEQWRSELVLLDSLEIERCMKPADFGEVETAELHHFSDASMSGYGQCSFLRLVSKTKQVNCCFVMGKSRVAPLKLITVPRLELTAAVTSVRVSAYLKQELQLSVDSEWFWTDSQIVLGYIANDVRRFHVFVANRVQQIRDRSNPDQWKHVSGEHNPADDGSRGLNVKELKTSKWLHGPEFLWNIDLSSQMLQTKNFEVTSDDPEVKVIKHAKVFASVAQHSSQTFTCFLERFSDWHKIKRVVARCLKWRALGRSEISIEDMRSAEIAIVRAVQAESFSEEITVLKSLEVNEGSSIRSETCKKKKALKRKSSIFKLDPFLDSDGLLRVGGRLKQASFQEELVHPVILPKKHNLTRLIVQYFHARVKHQGRGMTVNEIRSNGYWIVGCCSLVAWFISKCVTCRKLRTRSQIQKMSDLPKVRCESVPPFTDCAVDLFGPFLIKEGRKELKRYGVIFTCMACRAIHLETANSMTTDSFISSLRRFLSLRGPIRTLHCDQGTNFVGAKNELFGKLKDMDQDAIQQYLQKEGCDYFDFRMNTPASSHMGGVWERLIRSVRSVLATLMEESGVQLDDEGLRTMMCEVTAIVNCRPITTDTLYDATSLEALTPNHLLTMKPKILLQPSGSFKREDIYCRQRWKRVQYLMNQFWSRWRREYLQTLQVRQKWVHPQRDVQVGDIVLVKDDDLPRNQWMLGRVIETIKDSDEHVRKVKLMIGSCELDRMGKRGKALSVLERPIHKTVLLLESDDQ